MSETERTDEDGTDARVTASGEAFEPAVEPGDEDNPWRRVSRRIAYANPWLTIYHDEVVRPDGEPGIYGVVHFETFAVGVVPIDADDRVLLVGQYRYTLDRYSWEIPEGGAGLDEPAVDAAKRELLEETGYTADSWREIARGETSNSVTDETAVLFVATGLRPGAAQPEGTERLQLRWVPFDEAVAMIDRGEIRDMMAIVALQRLALERAAGRRA